jgi:amino acid adenylation domain-containing protein
VLNDPFDVRNCPGDTVPIENAGSLVAVLQRRADLHPLRTAYTFLMFGESSARSLTYAELDREARQLAVRLQQMGMQGERALLLYPAGLDYIVAFFACLYAGTIAVPAYPPSNNRHMPRLKAILGNCGAKLILSTIHVTDTLRQFAGADLTLLANHWLATDALDALDASRWQGPDLRAADTAFLQYTSGSTGDAKGVTISHGNLIANQRLIKRRFGHGEQSTVVGWLPLYHDMGLIGNVMQPLYCGASAVLMSPLAFLEKPLRWLQAISDYRAHTSGGPNFAYDLCVQKIGEHDKTGLDLSRWELAFNGAEPVKPDTLRRFSEAFAGCGFRRQAFYPCYGLAEATLLATGGAIQSDPRIAAFDKTGLEQRTARPVPDADPNARRLVSCGSVESEQDLRVVDPATGAMCPAGRIGEIWLGGPGIAEGYWQNAEATERTFIADAEGRRWLRTGDLGFIDGSELFISGRLKDLIIVRGRNYYPHDLEYAVETATDALNPASAAAFAVDEGDGEKVVVVAELKRGRLRQGDYRAEFAAMRARLTDECGVQADRILLLKPGAVLKTSSGKVRRGACRELYLRQGFQTVAVDVLEAPAAPPATGQPADERDLLRRVLLSMNRADAADLLAEHLVSKAAELAGLADDTVDPGHSLTGLGLDSLKAVEMKYRIDELLEIDLPLAHLLGHSTLRQAAAQALELAQAAPKNTGTAPCSNETAARNAMSYNQQALWTQARMQTGEPLYHMPVALALQGHVDHGALRQALADLCRRHEQLRSGFGLDAENRPGCLPLAQAAIPLERADCAGQTVRDAHLGAFVREPFDLQRGPLLRCALFSCGETDHILVFCAHHLIVDFRSLQVLLADFRALYSARLAGQEVPLSASTATYADFVRWQQDYLASATAERDRQYWRRQLAGELPHLELPGERQSAGSPSQGSGAAPLHIAPAMLDRLKALAAARRTTLYAVLLTVFKTLLYRYGGQHDLIVGSPTLCRPQRAFADLAGYFVNPVALRSRPFGERRFCDYLEEVDAVVLAALEHQYFPYALLAEQVPPRTAGEAALFRAWFVLQAGGDLLAATLALNQPDIALQWPGAKAASYAVPGKPEAFDLALSCAETGAGLTAVFSYRCEILARTTVQRLLGHFESLLCGILDDPLCRLSELPMLTAPERRQLAAWNETDADLPTGTTVVGMFEAAAARQPAAVALIFGGQHFSYGELNARANRLAHFLIAQGAGPECRIALSMPRSLELVVGLLAILKAGAVYVPVDPGYPGERQSHMLRDAGVDSLLTVAALAPALDAGRIVKICVDAEEAYAAYSAVNPAPAMTPDNAAYVIYTSGSTGRPKGVVISHANLLHSTLARHAYYREPVGCHLLLPSFAFDSSVAGIFWTLSQGGCLCLPHDRLLKEPLGLGALIERHRVTHLLTLPSLYQLLLEHLPSAALQSLRTAIVAGEACPGALGELHFARLPETELFNEYGPTEATVWCSVYSVTPDDAERTLSIGRAIANMRLYVVDAGMQPVPVGVAGELWAGGDGISRGYFGQPDLTAERFVPDPFGNDGGRLYRTGDRVRYRADGNIEFLGRFDQQVKIRGYRIELGEVEACLLRHPAVTATAVVAREDVPGIKRLIAYWTGDREQQEGVKAQLKAGLPEYMLPSAWQWLEAIPLNANGKLDRKALPLPGLQPEREQGYVAPRDGAEEAVAAIWREVLGVERLGIHDDFFELGGHSLAGVQVMAKVQELFAIELPVNVLFEATTIARFVDRIAEYEAG